LPPDLPSGTVTFLFTDIEGSTQLALKHRAAWEGLRQRHHAILHAAVQAEDGYVFQIIGDAFCVAFHTPAAALRAAAGAQRLLYAESWGEVPLRVRMGIHTGEAHPVEGQYRGYLALSSVQRVVSAGHGGQVLLSQSTFELAQDDFPDDVAPRDLGPHRLKDLRRAQHLFQLVISGLPSDFPAVKSLDAHPHNLPIQLTSFVGRDKEIAQVGDLVRTSHLVTLTGVGGTGKTRLALQVAAEMVDHFEDGAWLVELAPLTDPLLVTQAIAAALGVGEQPGRAYLDVLKDFLRSKQLLIVLDNCEHLIEACAQAADSLLHAASGLHILATSREALGITGEVAYPVRSLALPASSGASEAEVRDSEAVRMFADRAAAVQPGFTVNSQNWDSILRICARLDGIPLALELAAARVKALNPEQLASRLDDRFRLLTGGSRTALPRQRTLEATIDWSYRLLGEDERLLLRRLSVFAGGWTLEAAEAISSDDHLLSRDILDLLLHLVDKSLVISNTEANPTRYHMLETIRQFAQERLDESGEADDMRRRQAGYFQSWVSGMAMELRAGPTQLQRFAQLDTDQDNIKSALEWSLGGGDPEVGLRLVGDIFYYWWRDGHWLDWARWTIAAAGRMEEGSEVARAGVLVALCGLELHAEHDEQKGRPHAEQALAIYRRLEDPRNIAWSLLWLNTASITRILDDTEYARATSFTAEAIHLMKGLADQGSVAQALTNLGEYERMRKDLARARATYQEGLEIAGAIGDVIREQILLANLGQVAMEEGDYAASFVFLRRGLESALAHNNPPNVLYCLVSLAWLCCRRGKLDRSARLMGAHAALAESAGVSLQQAEQAQNDQYAGELREKLGDGAYEALLQEGRAMTMEQAIAYALADAPE
jgi:predicted ATPase/class 3 adenylate cyclase